MLTRGPVIANIFLFPTQNSSIRWAILQNVFIMVTWRLIDLSKHDFWNNIFWRSTISLCYTPLPYATLCYHLSQPPIPIDGWHTFWMHEIELYKTGVTKMSAQSQISGNFVRRIIYIPNFPFSMFCSFFESLFQPFEMKIWPCSWMFRMKINL